MSRHISSRSALFLVCTLAVAHFSVAQQEASAPAPAPPRPTEGTSGPPAGAAPRGPGGPGGMMQQEVKLVEKFDRDGDGKLLESEERKAAREFLAKERAEGRLGRPFGRPGGPRGGGGAGGGGAPGAPGSAPAPRLGGPVFPGSPGRGENQSPPEPGVKLSPSGVKNYPAIPLYDPSVVRTLFFEFADSDWEKQLADFHNTDVEVPAQLTVDGKIYKDVGVHMRGMSSFMMVGEGRKRSLGVSIDFVHEKQKLGGYHSLHLLNSHEDPSFLRTVLFCQIAREYLPAPKANLVRVVINGENWGVYSNQQTFTKEFSEEWFGTKKGARWKAPGSPMGRAGLEYTGKDAADYKRRFEIKSKDDPKAWADLIALCRTLNQTSPEQLEEKLAPILDIDGALRFLALDNALINNDGYWIRASDYALYEDESGRFHILPHDTNETFARPGGPGFGRGPGGSPGADRLAGSDRGPEANRPVDPAPVRDAEPRPALAGPDGSPSGGRPNFGGGPRIKGVELDPLPSADDARKPLLSKLLAVPKLREHYLGYIRDIAEKWLDWNRLGPIAEQSHALIAEDVRIDTRKLESTADFDTSLTGGSEPAAENPDARGPRRAISVKEFADQRRAFLLNHPAIKALGAGVGAP